MSSKEWWRADSVEEFTRLCNWLQSEGYRDGHLNDTEYYGKRAGTVMFWHDHEATQTNLKRYVSEGDAMAFYTQDKVINGYGNVNFFIERGDLKFRRVGGGIGANAMARRMFASPNQVKTSFRRKK